MTGALSLFCACAPGLEPLLADELRALGAAPAPVPGGVELAGDLALAYRANLELGLALKVLARLGAFEATRFADLMRRTRALPWPTWLAPGVALRLRVTCRRSRLYHSGAVAERVREAIEARLGATTATPAADEPGIEVHVRLDHDRCTVSIDLSGEPLSRRGYRETTGKAPLREDLARAVLVASGWDRASPLVDPMCGAGTLPIEAGLLATRTPPGVNRRFAFMDVPEFDAELWRRLRDEALERVIPLSAPVFGSDRDAGAVAAAAANAARAGVNVALAEAAMSRAPGLASAAPTGALVTNPPYGKRVGRADTLPRLYRALGDRVRALPRAWRVGLVTASPGLARATGLALRSALMTDHGGGKIYLCVSD